MASKQREVKLEAKIAKLEARIKFLEDATDTFEGAAHRLSQRIIDANVDTSDFEIELRSLRSLIG